MALVTRLQQHAAVHVTVRLRLQTVALHDVLERAVVAGHLQAATRSDVRRKLTHTCRLLTVRVLVVIMSSWHNRRTAIVTDTLHSHLCHDVDGAHDDLVEVALAQQLDVVRQRVLEARPRLLT